MNWRLTPKRRVAAALGAAVAVVAPLTISASTPTVSVAEMAAAQFPAARTGVTNQTVTTTILTTTTTTSIPTTVPPPPPQSSSQAVAILALVNVERTNHGLQPLQLEARLNAASQQHTLDQGLLGDIYHVAPDGTGPGERIKAVGYEFSSWGENVAAGQNSAEAVMEAWMNSPGHCRNILNPGFTELGVGYVETSSSYRTWWTQTFARERGVPRPPGIYDPAWC